MCAEGFSERLFPIGALSELEVANIRLDPMCADKVSLDEVLQDWRTKSALLRSRRSPPLDAVDSDLLPLHVSASLKARIDSLLASYRVYLPTTYDLALVPLNKLVSPQRHVILEYVRASLGGLNRPLTDEENAEHGIGVPVRDPKIDATFLGYESPNHGSQDTIYVYQFSSDDQNMRFIPAMPLKPFQDVDLATDGAADRYGAKALSMSVGPGLPFVHVLKVPLWTDPSSGRTVYRLIIGNGVHRIFRLAELGNTHAAAIVQTIDRRDIPETYVETPREALFAPTALRVTDMADRSIGRAFRWKKAKRVLKLRVRVSQELSFVP